MTNIDTSKQWFQTGDFPTQAQFYQVFEWLRWKDEELAITDVTGLQDILNSLGAVLPEAFTVGGGWDNQYTIPAGFLLEKIIVVPVIDAYPYCGYVGGSAGDIVPVDLDTIVNAEGAVWVLNIFAATEKVIEITDMPATSKVYFIKKQIL